MTGPAAAGAPDVDRPRRRSRAPPRRAPRSASGHDRPARDAAPTPPGCRRGVHRPRRGGQAGPAARSGHDRLHREPGRARRRRPPVPDPPTSGRPCPPPASTSCSTSPIRRWRASARRPRWRSRPRARDPADLREPDRRRRRGAGPRRVVVRGRRRGLDAGCDRRGRPRLALGFDPDRSDRAVHPDPRAAEPGLGRHSKRDLRRAGLRDLVPPPRRAARRRPRPGDRRSSRQTRS